MRTLFLSLFTLVLIINLSLLNKTYAQVNLQIPSTNIAPVIDGTIDAAWDFAQVKTLDNMISPIGGTLPSSDFSATFKTLWDASALYVLAVVTDDSKINDSGEVWQDDAVEVYIDIDNNKLTSFGSNDYGYSFRWNDPVIYSGPNAGVEFIITNTANGYILEVKFPWTTLGLANPHPGILLGFDVQIHDDDDGAERDNKFAWFATTDDSWYNPSLFATARLINSIDSDSVYVTFQVNMQNEVISPKGVYLNGSFSDWNEALALEGDGNIFTGTLLLKKGETIEYKFINGEKTDWDQYENPVGSCSTGGNNNRVLIVPNFDENLELVCFGSCTACESNIEPDLQIGSTVMAPIIDGTVDALWSNTPGNEMTHLLIGPTSSADLSASFKTIWDEDNLYVVAVVTDDNKLNDSGSEIWNDDGLEIFIDINNDKLPNYGATDFQYSFRWNDQTIYSQNSHTNGVQFKIKGTTTGYIFEAKFPWATMSLAAPAPGVLLGFDIHVNDDDDGGYRDSKVTWFTNEDNSWQNPSLFSIAKLVDKIVITYPADKPRISAEKGFYENPFDATITTVIPGMDIYYTLDGSDPAISPSKQKSQSPVVVRIDPASTQKRGKTPGVILRARAKKDGYGFSPAVTRTYLFLNEVKNQIAYPGHDWPSTDINGQRIDLLMDTKVLDDNRYKNLITDALTEIPTISISTDNENLFNPNTGIYVNTWDGRGLEWERPASVELINPDGSDGFQIDAGLRIRGGWSRNDEFRKHAFRLFFRDKYGEGKLNFPLFEDEGVKSFDKIDLRCSQNYSWSSGGGDADYCTFTRDVFSRDVQGAMHQPYTRSRFYHLYLNGLYWGLYQTQERSEANYAVSYFGGIQTDYDVVKRVGNVGAIEATDGTLDSWQKVWDLCPLGFLSNTNYYTIQGLDATGKRDLTLKVLVDIDNLIDYMNVIFYTGNFDAPVSKWGGNKDPNNLYAIYNRNDDKGFQFFAHDNEHTLLVDYVNHYGIDENRVNIGSINTDEKMEVWDFSKFQPQWLHFKLSENAEYRMRFADRAYRDYYNNGILTPEKTAALFRKRTLEIDTAVIAESARWGDVDPWALRTKDDNWVPMVNRTLNEYFPYRTNIVINQLKEEGLLPAVVAPVYKKSNVIIEESEVEFSPGNSLSIINSNGSGSVKYTVDGSDPRLTGGGVSTKAVDGGNQANISILQPTIINARIFSSGNWSPLHTLKVIVDTRINGLQLTEIHYNPLGGEVLSGNEYEFIELKNRGTTDINLTASTFIDGIKYSFNSETIIKPGKFVVLSSSAYLFQLRYNFAPSGEYDGQLDNGGERITLIGATGDTIISVKYNDKAPWPTTPDSLGFSLVPAVNELNADWDEATNWRASSAIGGSPNADDVNLNILPVFVNEVLTNSEQPSVDAIELYNPNNVQVNIGGWYLSDKRDTTKWKIPAGTTIPAKSYKVIYEGHYVNSTLSYSGNEFGNKFSLSSHGDEVYIFSANSSGDLTGYEHGFDFGEIETGVSFGRHINSVNKEHFVAQSTVTLNQANGYPRVGPVVINQIMYHPVSGNFEFIELVNTSSGVVKLFDENDLTTWKISGINFDFPPNITLAAGESVYLVEPSISPEDFRFLNYLDAGISVFNFSGSLKNEGEEITLFKSAPQYSEDEELKTPYIRIDKVDYNDNLNWPDADGNGNVLLRKNLTVYGNDPANWIAAPQRVSINTYALNNGIEGVYYSKQLTVSGGTPPYSWSTVSGNLPTGMSLNPVNGIIAGTPTQSGTFNVTVSIEDQAGGTDEVDLNLTIMANNQPVAINDAATTLQNFSVVTNVIDNDTDLDGDRGSWIVTIATQPLHGTAIINNDRTITYTPSNDYFGNDELTYRVTDYKGSSQARLIISITNDIITAEIDVRVNQSSDDAEENISTNQLYLTSTDLELTYDVQGWDQIIGIRFQNIEIPKGATITNATIQFQTDETVNTATSLTIQGDDNDNPPTFSDTNRISSRPRTTTSVTWQPESWDIAHDITSKQKSPDLKDIVQEIVDRTGWNQGNAMAIIISGTGSRIAVAYDDANFGITGAPLLHIEFETEDINAAVPIANAGTNHSAQKGSLVQLDGSLSASSDGRSLNYHWTLASKPAGSNAVISNASIVNPTFVPDIFGAYLINLMVDNGVNESTISLITISVDNHQPIANAGGDQTHIEGTFIRLNGSASSDADGDQLTYIWTIATKPAGSTASLSNASIVNPTFTADKAGTYTINLTVFDGTVSSIAEQVVVTATLNQAPIADAGSNEEVISGSAVTLDGSKSSDPEGGALTYTWTVVSKPTASTATITNPTNKKPSIQTDKAGEYVIKLIVSDGTKNSLPDEVIITAIDDLEPIAFAGDDQNAVTGQKVMLDGSGSYDPEGKSLSFQWSFITKPEGSNATLSNPGNVSTSFTPDVKGLYSIRLRVFDGTFNNDDAIQVNVQKPDEVLSLNIYNSLKVYPNPFKDRLVVEYNSTINQQVTFSLYNISGMLVKAFEFDSFGNHTQVLNIDEEKLKYGIYLLVMKPENGDPKVVKVNYQGN